MKDEPENLPASVMRVRGETRQKIEAIANHKRWTLIEAIDAIADAFITSEGIEVQSAAPPASSATEIPADSPSGRAEKASA